MSECALQSHSVPQLPLEILTNVVSMLPKDGTRYLLKNRLRLAAVSRELRQAVLSSIQQMKRRHIQIVINHDAICANDATMKTGEDGNDGLFPNHLQRTTLTRRLLNSTRQVIRRIMPNGGNHDRNSVNVENELRSRQTECIVALQVFAQPNSLDCSVEPLGRLRYVPENQFIILTHFSPLSLSLYLRLMVGKIGVDSPLDRILKVVASKTNLETLRIYIYCADVSARAAYMRSLPSVPKNSPFNHLLTLKNLRAFYIDSFRLLSPAHMADLLNRSQSKITNICFGFYTNRERDKLFEAMSDIVRANVTSICCVEFPAVDYVVDHILNRLPNCATIHCLGLGCASRRGSVSLFNQLGDQLLDSCPGRTLECSVGCQSHELQEYLEKGGETQMQYTRDDSVVRLSIELDQVTKQKHCPFNNNPRDFL